MSSKIVISSKRNLSRKYRAALAQIESRLQRLIQADQQRGIATRVAYLDDLLSLQPFGISDIANVADARSVKDLLDKILSTWSFDHILILGGDQIIPFFRFDNPAGDSDTSVTTDNPYANSGSASGSRDDFLVPDRSLGRLPDEEIYEEPGISPTPELLLRQLDRLSEYQCAGAEPGAANTIAVSAEDWRGASQAVLLGIGITVGVTLSPPLDIRQGGFPVHSITNKRIHYWNCHGSRILPLWAGQGGTSKPPCMHPDELRDAVNVADSLVSSEACHGANIIGKNVQTSICLKYLWKGAIAFQGSTTIAYGMPNGSLRFPDPNIWNQKWAADLMSEYFLTNCLNGASCGESLQETKYRYFEERVNSRGGLLAEDKKTLLQFVLYGDPSIRVSFAPAAENWNKRLQRAKSLEAIGTARQILRESDKGMFTEVPDQLFRPLSHILEEVKRAQPDYKLSLLQSLQIEREDRYAKAAGFAPVAYWHEIYFVSPQIDQATKEVISDVDSYLVVVVEQVGDKVSVIQAGLSR